MYDYPKAREAILYIAGMIGPAARLRHVLDLLYLADKEHLSKYGRTITGDRYYATAAGPTPRYTDREFKSYGPNSGYCIDSGLLSRGTVPNIYYSSSVVTVERTVDMMEFSRTDVECMDAVFERFAVLGKDADTSAYAAARDRAWSRERDGVPEKGEAPMPLLGIALACPNALELIAYLLDTDQLPQMV